ncbi:MAG: porin [Sulfurimonas sp.]
MKTSTTALSIFTALLLTSSAFASEATELEALKQEVKELREMTNTLVDETSDLKTGFSYTTVDTQKSHSGLGSAASKVYYSKSPLSIGGYGEMYYAQTTEGDAKVDVYRFVPYIGYKFSDNIILNVELEFEHGGVKDGAAGDGYVVVEFMYLDFLLNKNANLRVGNMLMPMGLINEKHEPTLFTTVQRPNTEKTLIPSTWHESGVMAYGEIAEGLSYRLGGFTALDLSMGAGKGDSWLRDSRIGSFGDTQRDDLGLGVVARVDYTGINGLLVGASGYTDTHIKMYDIHADYKLDAMRLYGVYTQTTRSDAPSGEPESAKGGYINASYDMLSFTSWSEKMPLFVQYESVAAQDTIAGGTSVAPKKTTTVGINYFPHEQVVLKADYAMQTQENKTDLAIASVSMGFIF